MQSKKWKQKMPMWQLFPLPSLRKAVGNPNPFAVSEIFSLTLGATRGQCTYQHPQTAGRSLRCGLTRHAVADCRRPRRDSAPPASSTTNKKGKGRRQGPPLPKRKKRAKDDRDEEKRSGTSGSNTPAQGKTQVRQPLSKRNQQHQ